jgi:hypothetical protein
VDPSGASRNIVAQLPRYFSRADWRVPQMGKNDPISGIPSGRLENALGFFVLKRILYEDDAPELAEVENHTHCGV